MDSEIKIWTEKYRPSKFEELQGQKKIIERIKSFVKQKNIPHLLLAGPAGIGKTTASLIIAKTLYGEEWRNNFLELNASDARGIDIIRGQVKDFAKTKSIGDVGFKLILLDECDSLTKEAQQALRRTMENYANTCRFILSCNYSSKIIDPIQSRCAVFHFKHLEKEEVKKIIESICKKEDIKIDEKAINALYTISSGDVRKIVNLLQSSSSITKNITEEHIYETFSLAKPKEILEILTIASSGNFIKARELLIDTMLKYGLSGLDIIKQIQKEIWNLDIKNENKVKMIERCGEIEFRLVEGSDEFVQLGALLASFTIVGK